jgi:tripartite-type tricarboxylate transporter receptor subunit TctC
LKYTTSRRDFLKLTSLSSLSKPVVALTGLTSLSNFAQNSLPYPSKPIRFIVPFAVGGSGDLISRVISEQLTKSMGQAWVIENKGGNGSVLGTEIAAKSNPDGYNVVLSNGAAITIGPLMGQQMGYKPMEDLIHVCLLGTFTNSLIVRADHPAKSFSDFLSLARQNPGKISYSSAGVGSAGYLTGELLKHLAKLDMVHIPYKGTGPAMTDLLGGQIDAMFNALIAATPYIKSGKVRALAVTSQHRISEHPDIPTMNETINGAIGDAWFGISVPAKTPQVIVERLRSEIFKIMEQAETKQRLQDMGLNSYVLGPKEFNQFLNNEYKKWSPVIKGSNLSASS